MRLCSLGMQFLAGKRCLVSDSGSQKLPSITVQEKRLDGMDIWLPQQLAKRMDKEHHQKKPFPT
jgi:hypothetical protein